MHYASTNCVSLCTITGHCLALGDPIPTEGVVSLHLRQTAGRHPLPDPIIRSNRRKSEGITQYRVGLSHRQTPE